MSIYKNYRFGEVNVNIHALSVISFIALIFAESSIYSLAVVLCAMWHELGHIIAIYILGAGIAEISFLPFGVEIRMKNELSYRDDLIVAAAGPFFNLLSSGVFYVAYMAFPHPFLVFCAVCSLFLCGINLVPVKGFDGGRMVRSVVFSLTEYEKALKFIKISELLAFLLLTYFSLFAVKLSCFNISLIAICLYLFLSVYLKEHICITV